MKRWSGPRRCRRCSIPILRLDGAPFGGPILTLERADLQQLFIVIDLVFSVQPTLAENIIICLENMDEGCRRGGRTTDDSVEKIDLVGGESCEFGY